MVDSGVKALWAAHQRTPFPSAARGTEVNGVDLVLLDSLVAGCVSSLLDANAVPDITKLALLRDLFPQVEGVLPSLVGESRVYFSQLAQVVVETLSDEASQQDTEVPPKQARERTR